MKKGSIVRLNSILDKGTFQSKVSSSAKKALISSIKLRKKYTTIHSLENDSTKNISLDFTEVNKQAIKKRGNLKVYQNLPKGIRVVA